MRTLFAFIARYANFFLFLFLEGISFFLIYHNNYYHQNVFVEASNELRGTVYSSVNTAQDYFRLKVTNDSLLEENNRLREQLHKLKHQKRSYNLNRNLELFLTKKIATSPTSVDSPVLFHYVPARVVNKTVNRPNNYLTINKGREDGIRPKMGVLSLNGAVGVVKDVSKHFSTVITLLHKEVRVSAKIEENDYFGSVRWESMDPTLVSMEDIPKQAEVEVKDKVVTTGYSSLFPSDILIGRIKDYYLEEGTGFYSIDVRLATNFHKLEYVYVVDYFYQREKEQLEEQTYNE